MNEFIAKSTSQSNSSKSPDRYFLLFCSTTALLSWQFALALASAGFIAKAIIKPNNNQNHIGRQCEHDNWSG